MSNTPKGMEGTSKYLRYMVSLGDLIDPDQLIKLYRDQMDV